MKKLLSALLCAALLISFVLACAEGTVFDDSVFAGKKGYTAGEDGSWSYVRGGEFPYPGFVIAVRISVSGKRGESAGVPRLEVALLKKKGSDEAGAAVSGVTFYTGQKAYAYGNMEPGTPYASVPLFAQGKELIEAFAKATDLTVRVYYNNGQKSVYDISNYFRSELSAMAKDLLSADYWAVLTDADGQWAAAEEACPLKVSKQ